MAVAVLAAAIAGGNLFLNWRHDREWDNRINAVAWSPDGELLAMGNLSGQTKLVTAEGRETIAEASSGRSEIDRAIAWSPDGTRLASNMWDGTGLAVVWDTSLNLIGSTKADSSTTAIAWSHDGATLAVGSEDRVRLVDADNLKRSSDFGLGWAAESLAWSGDGTMIAASAPNDMESTSPRFYVGSVERSGTIQAVPSPAFSNPLQPDDDVTGMDWSPDGRVLAVATDGNANSSARLTIYDSTGEEKAQEESGELFGANELSWSPNSRLLAIAIDGEVRVLDRRTFATVGTFTGHKDASSTSQIDDISWAPDSDRIASTAGDDTVRIWDAKTFEQIGEPIGW